MDIFNFVKSRVSILDVISQYATLKKAGMYWKGCCPFHHEKTASFTVSPHKEIFYCFGCHQGGDVLTFINKVENCSILEAAQFLADRYNLDIPETLLKPQKESSDSHVDAKKRYHLLCTLVATWCHNNLLKSSTAQSYLHQRSLQSSSINVFNLGYFPNGQLAIKSLIEYVKKEQFLLHDLIEAGIVAEGKATLYSPFEERIIFPIADPLSRICGFGGRIYKTSDERAKYYNSKENHYFVKGTILFGLDNAKKQIQQTGTVLLVEGYTDCIAMVQHGFTNTVATLGTACTVEHLKLISRYGQHLYILYDGDKAGQAAMLRLAELCWQFNLELHVIQLPDQDDPASFLAKGGDLSPYLAQAPDIFIFFIESSTKSFNLKNLQEKVQTIRKLITIIERIDDPIKQDILLQKAAHTCEIPYDTLKQELGRQSLQSETPTEPSRDQDDPLKGISELEKKLFSVIINNIDLLSGDDEAYLLEYLAFPLRELLKKLQQLKGEHNSIDFLIFFDALDKQEKNLVSRLLLEIQDLDSAKSYEQLMTQFQRKNWKAFVHSIKLKLHKAQREGNEQDTKKIIGEFQELKKKLLYKDII